MSEVSQGYHVAEWQPIETAPRDGTKVLIWIPDRGALFKTTGMHVARYVSQYELWSMPGLGGLVPTHWMRLPTPPFPTSGNEP